MMGCRSSLSFSDGSTDDEDEETSDASGTRTSNTLTTGASKSIVQKMPGLPARKQTSEPSCIGCRYRESGVRVHVAWERCSPEVPEVTGATWGSVDEL